MAKEIEIPEGYEARIEGNKVIFELKESEDEKIRKTLLEYFNERNSYRDEDETFNGIPFPSIIAYLEKQKDNKFAPRVLPCSAAWFEDGKGFEQKEPGFIYNGESYSDALRQSYRGLPKLASLEVAHEKGFKNGYHFGTHEEQPHTWTRHDEAVRKEAIACLRDWKSKIFSYFPCAAGDYNNILYWLENELSIHTEKEQKPKLPKPHKGDDTNPYDMSVSEAQEYAINRGFGIPFNDGEVFVDERHITQTIGNILRWADEHPKEQKPASGNSEKPNNHAEWSENEEKDIQEASDYLRDYANNCVQGGNSKLYVQSLADRIESLRPQPHWKPSVEQMLALGGVLDYLDESDNEDADIVRELINDLKNIIT